MKLAQGMDFREPKYRREVFLKFYEFHIKYKAHPGAVYYAFPYLFEHYKMTTEQKLWFCFINGVCQNVVTTWTIWQQCPDLKNINPDKLKEWFDANWSRLGWDTDRRYVKSKFFQCVDSYLTALGDKTQEEYFNSICNTTDEEANFRALWKEVMKNFAYFGRLATFSYLEYLRIAGVKVNCDNLFFEDMSGSKSHRNGMCKVLGRDDLDWYDKNPSFKGYAEGDIEMITSEAKDLLAEAKKRFDGYDVNYFTLESTLCCYKSWHRPNRRYPNVYNDMFHDRIKWYEKRWAGVDFGIFWEMRKANLPKHLRLEDNPKDVGLHPYKQNHYLQTGQVIMMDKDFPEFKNWYNDERA
jgi:hypothetical protein